MGLVVRMRVGDGKSQGPALVRDFIGVRNDFRRFRQLRELRCSAPSERVEAIAASIDAILDAGSFEGSRGPSKLAGKLHASLSWSHPPGPNGVDCVAVHRVCALC